MVEINWLQIEEKAKNNLQEIIFENELIFQGQIDSIAQEIVDKKDVKVIFIAGPSSSGKTTFSNRLMDKIRTYGVQTHYIGLDDYFIDRDKLQRLPSGMLDFDSPSALDIEFVKQSIKGILVNASLDVPRFDFITGKSIKAQKRVNVYPNDVVLLEGIHSLNPMFTDLVPDEKKYKISISPKKVFIMPSGTRLYPEELRMLRRTIRDVNTRGNSLESTAKQWGDVCDAEKKYITPYMNDADYTVDSAFNYELFLYKRIIKNDLDSCNLEQYAKLRQAMGEITYVPHIEIPKQSLLNEFAIQ